MIPKLLTLILFSCLMLLWVRSYWRLDGFSYVTHSRYINDGYEADSFKGDLLLTCPDQWLCGTGYHSRDVDPDDAGAGRGVSE